MKHPIASSCLLIILLFALPSVVAEPETPQKPGDSTSELMSAAKNTQSKATVAIEESRKRAAAIAKKNDELVAKAEDMMIRQEADLTRQEAHLARFDKILATWERQQAEYQRYLDSLPKR